MRRDTPENAVKNAKRPGPRTADPAFGSLSADYKPAWRVSETFGLEYSAGTVSR